MYKTLTIVVMASTLGCTAGQSEYTATLQSIDKREALLERDLVMVFNTLCESRCDANYQACILFQAQMNIAERVGVGNNRTPAKVALPGCWPFACSDEQEREAIDNPAPNCVTLHEECLAACQ